MLSLSFSFVRFSCFLMLMQDNLDRVPTTLSEVRGEDAQCMQQLEAFQVLKTP